MARKLTKRTVESIQPPESGADFLFDTELRGFGVRTTSKGVQAFILNDNYFGRSATTILAGCH